MAKRAGGFELGTAWVTLTVDGSELSGDIKKAMDDASAGASTAGQKAGNEFGSKLGNAAKTAAKATGAAVGTSLAAGAGVALTKGFGRLKAIENAQAKLVGLGKSGQEVANIMDSASKAVEGTAFGLGDAAGLASQMVASGIKPGEELTRVLTTVADTAAMSGDNLADMGLIFGSVAAKGKLQGDDMFQLLSRQLPMWDILSEHIGKTKEEVQDMSSKGQIDFKMFSEAMEEYLGGSAQAMGYTVEGAFKNLGAAMGRLGEVWLSPVFAELPGWLTALRDGVNELKTVSGPGADALSKFVDSIDFDSETAVNGIHQMIDAVEGFKNSDFGSAAIDGTVDAVKALYEAGENLLPIMGEIGKIAGKIGGATYLTFVNATEALAKVFIAMSPAVESVAGAIASLPAPVLAGAAAWAKFGGTVTDKVIPGFKSVNEFAKSSATALRYHNSDLVEASNLYGVAGGQIGAMTKEQYKATEATKKAGGAWKAFGKEVGNFAKTTGIIMAAGLAVDALVYAVSLDDKEEDWLDYIENGSERAKERVDSLSDSFAKFTAGSKEHSAAVKNFTTDYLDELSTRAEETKSLWGATDKWLNEHVFGGDFDDNASVAMQTWADNAEKAVGKLREVFGDDESIAKVAMGSKEEFDEAINQLASMGDEGYQAALRLMELRGQMQQAAEESPRFRAISDAMKTLADETSSTSEKVKALNALLNPDEEPTLNLTLSQASDQVRELAGEMAKIRGGEDVDFMAKFFDDQGNILTSVQGATQLQQQMYSVRDSVQEIIAQGGSTEQAAQTYRDAIEQMAEGAGVSFEQMADIFGRTTGLTEEAIDRQVATFGSTSETLAEFRAQFADFAGEPMTISMNVQDPEPELIEKLGNVEGAVVSYNENLGKLEIGVDSEHTATEVEKILADSEAKVHASPAMNIMLQLEKDGFEYEFEGVKYELEALEGDTVKIRTEGHGVVETEAALNALRDAGLSIPENIETKTSLFGRELVVSGLDDIITKSAGVERDIKTQTSAPGAEESRGLLERLRGAADAVPEGESVLVTTPGASESKSLLDLVRGSADAVPESESVSVTAPGAQQAKADVDGFGFSLRSLPRWIEVPVRAVTSWVGDKLGFGGHAGGGVLPALAGGGVFDYRLGGSLPRQGDSMLDGILAYSLTGGRPVAMVNGNEFVTNTRSSHLYRKVLELINQDDYRVQHLKHLAKGGSVSDSGSSAGAAVTIDGLHTSAGNIASMRAFQTAVAAFGDTVERHEQAEIEAERREAARQERVKKQTEALNEQRQRELDRLGDRFKDDRKSDAYRNAKKAIDEKYDFKIARIDPPDTRTATEKRRDEERAAARRKAETEAAVARAIAEAGVTGPAAAEIYEGVLGINEKSARNYAQTKRMDENVSKAQTATREAVIEAIRESSSGIAAAIDQAVAAWSGELVKIGEASRSAVLGDSGDFVDRMTGSVAAVTDAMVQRMMTGSASAIMPAMLGGSSGLSIGQIKAAGGLENRWNMYANHQRGRARTMEDLARTEEGLAEVARLVLTGGATEATLRATARQYGLADPSKFLGQAFIDGAEDYVRTLSKVIADDLNRPAPSKEVVDRLMAASSEFTVNFEQDSMDKLSEELEKFYAESREQVLRGMLTGDVSTISDELGQGMKAWSADINSSIQATMLDVRKGKRKNDFLEDAPKDLAEHMQMVQRGFAELLETGRVSADLITGLQLTPAEIKQYQQWGKDAQIYIGKSMGGRAQEIAEEIAEGISDKASSEWQEIIDDIASGFVRQVTTPVDEIFSLLGVEAPRMLTHDGLMDELKKADNWTEMSRQYAVAGAEAARNSLSASGTYAPVFHIHGVTDPNAVADAVDRRLAAPGGRAGRMLGR